jgi:hypothetical protein
MDEGMWMSAVSRGGKSRRRWLGRLAAGRRVGLGMDAILVSPVTGASTSLTAAS